MDNIDIGMQGIIAADGSRFRIQDLCRSAEFPHNGNGLIAFKSHRNHGAGSDILHQFAEKGLIGVFGLMLFCKFGTDTHQF